MNEKEYLNWKTQMSTLMKLQNEDEGFIEYFLSWMDSISGSRECELISAYHEVFKNASNEEIYEFMHRARSVPNGVTLEEFKNQIFNSAFFLYAPLLKMKYKKDK
jgi:hypothetical protein